MSDIDGKWKGLRKNALKSSFYRLKSRQPIGGANVAKLIDLTGKRFGRITVLERADDYISPSGHKNVRWKCKCDCGNKFIVKPSRLTSGKMISCGCKELENFISETVGRRFGKLICIGYSHKEYGVGHFFKFKCDCGNEIIRNISKVRSGRVNSCGCLREENARKAIFKDLTGEKFNYLTVIEYVGQKNKRTMWRCRCDCGNEVIVDTNSLKSGNTTACGCRQYLGWGQNRTHGMSKTRIYNEWQGMKRRCLNEKDIYYRNYGGRGITVCDAWIAEDGFENFYDWSMSNGYADNLTIDRIDNNKGYSPDNCRWSDRFTQMNNQRGNRIIEHNGRKQTLTMWAREYGLTPRIISSRLKYGWNLEDALNIPVGEVGNYETYSSRNRK